jgi:hypothetical protein
LWQGDRPVRRGRLELRGELDTAFGAHKLLVDGQCAPQEIDTVDADAEHFGGAEPGTRGGEHDRGVPLRHMRGEGNSVVGAEHSVIDRACTRPFDVDAR